MASGIYALINVLQPLFYIGQSINIAQRFAGHKANLRSDKRKVNKKLLHSWQKYGEEAFQFVVLEYCSAERLTERETYWLCEFRDVHGLNVANFVGPVDNPMRGMKHTPEAIEKMRLALSKVVRTEEHNRRIGLAHKGREKTLEERMKISAAKKGKPNLLARGHLNPSHRPEFKERMRLNNPAKRPEVRQKMSEKNHFKRPVRDVESGKVWMTMSACAAELGVTVAAVHAAASKKNKTVAGRVIERVKINGRKGN